MRLPQCHHAFLNLWHGLPRTVVRTPALLGQLLQPLAFPVPPQPQVARRPANLKLSAQSAHRFLATIGSNRKSHPLLAHVLYPPRHWFPPRETSADQGVKDVMRLPVKDVMRLNTESA